MSKPKRYSVQLLLCFLALGSARVWVDQNPMKEYYQEGDTAIVLCRIHSDQEKVEFCKFKWYIWNEIIPSQRINVQDAQQYHRRVTLDSNQTITSLTVKDLSVNDTDQLRCSSECFVDKIFNRHFGNGTILVIHDKNKKSGEPDILNPDLDADLKPDNTWIGFLLLSLNITVFLIISIVCVSIIKKMKKKI